MTLVSYIVVGLRYTIIQWCFNIFLQFFITWHLVAPICIFFHLELYVHHSSIHLMSSCLLATSLSHFFFLVGFLFFDSHSFALLSIVFFFFPFVKESVPCPFRIPLLLLLLRISFKFQVRQKLCKLFRNMYYIRCFSLQTAS